MHMKLLLDLSENILSINELFIFLKWHSEKGFN